MSGSIGTINLISQPGDFETRYFIGNPDITFFKSVYRKHTNFSKYLKRERRSDVEAGPGAFSIQTGSDDLLSKVYLENKFTFTRTTESTGSTAAVTIFANLGSNMIDDNGDDSLAIDIGGNKGIFKSNGLFQEIKGELENQMSLTAAGSFTRAPCLERTGKFISCKNGSHYNYTTLSGGVRGMELSNDDFANASSVIETEYFYTIPEFSFMKDYGLSIPLLSLRNEHITFNVRYQGFNSVFSAASNITAALESNFIQELIQLDTAEKSRFLTSQLTYLTENITQKDLIPDSLSLTPGKPANLVKIITSTFKLCKYLFLVGAPLDGNGSGSVASSHTTPQALNLSGLNIKLGGHSLYPGNDPMSAAIFTKLNINKYFIGCGRDLAESGSKSLGQVDSIAMIPFAIEPTNFTQPSGCVSTLGNSNSITIDIHRQNDNKLILFAINYGILQISDGKAQLQYS